MVKVQKISQEELLKEDERLERMFREKIMKTKNIQVNDKQFRNRLIDFLEIMSRTTAKNPKTLAIFIKRYPAILNKLCLSSRYDYLNGQKIIQIILEILQRSSAEFGKNLDAIDLMIKTIFNILIYKKIKHFVPELIKMISILLSAKNLKVDKLIEKNLDVLTNFLEKGKDIDKVFFSFKKIISKSSFCLKTRFEELIFILSKTKNSFFIEHFLKFLVEVFTVKVVKETSTDLANGNGHSQDKQTLAYFNTLDKHILAIYENLAPRENPSTEQVKRSLKMKTILAKIIEQFLSNHNVAPGTQSAKVLESLRKDISAQKNQATSQGIADEL